MGTATEPLKTMNPDDKYETPRPPPPTPKLARLNTSTGYETYLRMRPTRSQSPKSSRSPWSPRMLFGGPKTPLSATSSSRDRGRTAREGDANISYPVLISRTDEGRKCVSLQDMDGKPVDSTTRQERLQRYNSLPKLNLEALELDDDDDANFARHSIQRQHRDSQLQHTILSPPPSRFSSARSQSALNEHAPTLRLLTATDTSEAGAKSKPLPSIPVSETEATSLHSKSSFNSSLASDNSARITRTDIHIPSATSNWTPRSHFSMDSLDEIVQELSSESHNEQAETSESEVSYSGMISPTDSLYSDGCASPSSLAEYYDIDDAAPSDFSLAGHGKGELLRSDLRDGKDEMNADSPTRSEFQYNPMVSEVTARGFMGYSLPEQAEYASEVTLKRGEVTIVASDDATQIRNARATFGGPMSTVDESNGSMQGLMADLQYLGSHVL